MIRDSSIALTLIAVMLVACRAAPPPPTRAELLEKLHQCRVELTQKPPTGRSMSSCAKLDPSPLNGISRNELAAALGPPTFCVGLSEGGPPRGSDCPLELNPRWSFHLIGSGGLELFCATDEKQRCENLRWIDFE
jgi:hypothetical protein